MGAKRDRLLESLLAAARRECSITRTMVPDCPTVVSYLLERAEEDGYSLIRWPPHEVVKDLRDYADHEILEFSDDEVEAAVRAWQKRRGG